MGYFYSSPLFTRKLDTLQNMLGRSFLVVVTGEHGSGKTTLMHHLMAAKPIGWQSARVRRKADADTAHRLSMNPPGRPVYVSRGPDFPVLIMDDAHRLSTPELGALVRMARNGAGPRRFATIVLFAEPSIRTSFDTIAGSMPPRTAMERIDLAPLTEEQTVEYLSLQFSETGVPFKTLFSRRQLRDIYRASGGLPGRINQHAAATRLAMTAGNRKFRAPWPLLRLPVSFWKLKQVRRHPMPVGG